MQINYLVNYSCVRVRSGLSARIIPSIAIRQTKRICRHLPPPVPVPALVTAWGQFSHRNFVQLYECKHHHAFFASLI